VYNRRRRQQQLTFESNAKLTCVARSNGTVSYFQLLTRANVKPFQCDYRKVRGITYVAQAGAPDRAPLARRADQNCRSSNGSTTSVGRGRRSCYGREHDLPFTNHGASHARHMKAAAPSQRLQLGRAIMQGPRFRVHCKHLLNFAIFGKAGMHSTKSNEYRL
jgi:hypothetical protein